MFCSGLYSSDKDEPDAEAVTSMLGLQSYWDSAYADELANFREHGHAGEVWYDLVYDWFCFVHLICSLKSETDFRK